MSEQIYDAKAERAAIEYIQGQKVRLHGEGKAMKTDIEYAALLVADSMPRTELHKCGGLWMPSYGHYWNPLGDDGDSRRLEIASLNWIRYNHVTLTVAEAYKTLDDLRLRAGVNDVNAEQYRAAVFALAVAIGKTVEGNDNAGT
jgi:hypothetical protein